MSDLKRDPRKVLSKSFMQTACGEAAWFTLHQPLPWTPPEKVTFGSAVDAGCSAYIAMARRDEPSAIDMEEAYRAAHVAVKDEPNPPDLEEVRVAIDAFAGLPYDWHFSRIGMQAGSAKAFTIRVPLQALGIDSDMEAECHPDVVLRDHSIWDIKAGANRYSEDAAARSYGELGWYGLCYEAHTGDVVPEVGYLRWGRRVQQWQQLSVPFTDEMRDKAREKARRFAVGIRDSSPDINNTFLWPPQYGCGDCQYHPSAGGPCRVSEPLKEAA